MKITKSQFKEAVKAVVRECLNERIVKESEKKRASYKVASPNSVDQAEEDKAREIQHDPEVNESAETLPPNKGQYKVVPDHQYITTSQNKALTRQTDPKINEVGLTNEKKPDMKLSSLIKKKKGIAKENHKVQVRSYKTSNDTNNDPNNVRDPEVPPT